MTLQEKYFKYYDELPPPIAERAKQNYVTCPRPRREAADLPDAVDKGFWWDRTPEGHSFWSAVFFKKPYSEYPSVKGLPE